MPTPFVPFPTAVRSSLIYNCDGQTTVNTLHFDFATPPALADMNNLNTALHTFWTGHLKANIHAICALEQITTIGLQSPSSPGATLIIAGGEVGLIGAAGLPNNVTWCASLRTAARGRNFRGRFYVSGLAASQTNGFDYLTAVAQGAIQGALGWLLTPANISNFIFGVASRFLNGSRRSTGVITPINAIAGDLTLDSQRRRLPGRGA